MKTDIKSLLDFAGVDTSQGKAKQLVENHNGQEKIVRIIKDAQSSLITRDQAERELKSNNVQGKFDSRGGYAGYDSTNKRKIAVNVDGSLVEAQDPKEVAARAVEHAEDELGEGASKSAILAFIKKMYEPDVWQAAKRI